MKAEAKAILSAAGIEIGQKFASLTPAQLAAIREAAAATHLHKYGKPLPAADLDRFVRSRYDLLQPLN